MYPDTEDIKTTTPCFCRPRRARKARRVSLIFRVFGISRIANYKLWHWIGAADIATNRMIHIDVNQSIPIGVQRLWVIPEVGVWLLNVEIGISVVLRICNSVYQSSCERKCTNRLKHSGGCDKDIGDIPQRGQRHIDNALKILPLCHIALLKDEILV